MVKFEKGGSMKLREYEASSAMAAESKAKVDAQRMGMTVASVRLKEVEKKTKDSPAMDEAHQEVSADFKVTASGRKVPVQRKNVEDENDIKEAVKTTHEDPLVTVHDKDGLHTHANLSTANHIFNTNVKHTDVHKGPVSVTSGHEDKKKLKFAISQHHAQAVQEGVNKSDIPAYLRKKTGDQLTTKDLDKERTQNRSHPEMIKKINGTQSEAVETTHEFHLRQAAYHAKQGNTERAKYHTDRANEWGVKKDHDNTKRAEAELERKYRREDTELEEAVTVKKANYSWGKMVTVHHGSENSYPLHPEHQKKIASLKDGEHTSFTDETNRKVTAHREGDKVHLSGAGSNKKTTVDHKHFTESVEQVVEQQMHRVSVTVTDPHHPAVSMRNKKYEKRVKVKANDREHAVDSALHYYKKQGLKVHDHNYIGVAESFKIEEAMDKEETRLMQLARLGLVDKSNVSKLRMAMEQLKSDKPLSVTQRSLLLGVLEDLFSLVAGDDQVFMRLKRDVQKEQTEVDENYVSDAQRKAVWASRNEKGVKESENEDPPFDPDPPRKNPPAKAGKYGQGYSTARHLAQLALKKQQEKQAQKTQNK